MNPDNQSKSALPAALRHTRPGTTGNGRPGSRATGSNPGRRVIRAAQRPVVRGGFNLVELVLVVFVLGALMFLMWGPMTHSRAVRARADCAVQLMQLHVALALYAADATGRFPEIAPAHTSEAPLSLLVPRYISETRWFVCPGTGRKPPPAIPGFAGGRVDYAYYQGLRTNVHAATPLLTDAQINDRPKRVGEPVFSTDGRPPGNNHGSTGGNVLRVDGSVRFTPPRAAFDLPVETGVALLNPGP